CLDRIAQPAQPVHVVAHRAGGDTETAGEFGAGPVRPRLQQRFHAGEVADMLDSTVESVNSALKRARAAMQRRQPPAADHQPPTPGSASEDAIVAKFVRAWESADLATLVDLLTDDVFISMPPVPFEYGGRDVAVRFCAS